MQEVLNLVRTTISNKAAQLANYPVPRVLAICSEYWGTSTFFGPEGAAEIMYGGTNITVPINTGEGTARPPELTTKLQDAPFIRIKGGNPEVCRQSISAVLLVHLDDNACHILGLLHPDPAILFPISNLPSIPFARVAWPARILKVEWIIGEPEQAKFPHERVRLTMEELHDGVQTSKKQCGS